MAQTVFSADPTVAALQESVRHNEKNIDKLDRDLKDFRTEVLTQFQKVDDRFAQLEAKVDDRFVQLETKFDQRFEKVDQRFEKVDQQFEKVDQRFEKVDQKLEKINDRFNQTNMLLVTIVGLVVALIVKLVVFD